MRIPSVAVIILNYNNESYTFDCLRSLKGLTYQNYKIFLVDNGSEKADLEKLKTGISEIGTSEFMGYELLAVYPNVGFSGGNNVGIKKALEEGFEYILLLNNDTTVEPDFIEELVKVAESNANIGVVGSKIYFHPDMLKENELSEHMGGANASRLIWYAGGTFSWLDGGKHLHYEEVDKHPDEIKPQDTNYITGCSFLIKKTVIDKVGIMPEEFYLYYEDIDWSLAVKNAGYRLVYAPASKIYHKVSRTTKKMGNPKIHYYHIRNALLLTKKQAPLVTRIGVYIWSVFHYLKQIPKLVLMPHQKQMARMIMTGIEDFYKNKFGQYELIHP